MSVQSSPRQVSTHNQKVPVTVLQPDSANEDGFRLAFRNHPAGVALITADAGDGPVAMTATSVASVSVNPPLLVFSVSELSSASPTLRNASTIVVHLLGADQIELAKLGAASGVDRFANRSQWTRLPTGEPVFPAAQSWIRGRVVSQTEAGGSTIVTLQALETKAPSTSDSDHSRPLVYHDRAWHSLGEASRIG